MFITDKKIEDKVRIEGEFTKYDMKYHMKVDANETSFIQKFDHYYYKIITEFFRIRGKSDFFVVSIFSNFRKK